MNSVASNKPAVDTGTTIGAGYHLAEEISRGATASIYRAAAPDNGRGVAIKLFHPHYYADARFAVRFRAHLRRLAGLSHDNLVSVLDYGVDQKRYYIVMEWIDGIDLGTYLTEHGVISPSLASMIARRVCAALEAVHQHELVHQGIKPQNILLSSDGQVKLTDVGMTRLLSESGLSKTQVVLAGLGYIPPEQARGKKLTPQSDLYSLGAVLFEMLTGRLPFESNDIWSVVRMHAMDEPPSPRQINPQVPEELANIVKRAMQKDLEQRFPSAAEMEVALAALETDLDLGAAKSRYSEAGAAELSYLELIKALLEPGSIKRLLRSPWRIAGREVPFGVILIFQFTLAFVVAFVIMYLLAGR